MQIFYPGGIIMPALRPKHTVPAGDDRLIQVRARRISHLRRLRERYLPELGDIIEIQGTDYEYRAYCTHEQLAAALAKMALDIDYVKSKSQALDQYNDQELYNANNAVWGTLYQRLSTHKVFSYRKKGAKKTPLGTAQTLDGSSWSWGSGDSWHDSSGGPTVASIVGTATSDTRMTAEDEELVSSVPREWDDELPKVERFPNGNIDHSQCDHGQGRAAKRRCTRRNNKDPRR